MIEFITPKIVVDGRTFEPKGYEWILGFALAGCQWALDIVNDPEWQKSLPDKIRSHIPELIGDGE